jgi:UDP-N-acetylmuramyl pentapeptide synthase
MCLIATLDVFASPRTLLANDSQIEYVVKEMGVPVSGKFKALTSMQQEMVCGH